jgi:hypothetical protein
VLSQYKNHPNRKKRILSDTSDDANSDEISLQSSSEDEDFKLLRERCIRESEENDEDDNVQQIFNPITCKIGEFVAFKYEGKLYPGIAENCNEVGATIRSMTKSLKAWKWPVKKDVCTLL